MSAVGENGAVGTFSLWALRRYLRPHLRPLAAAGAMMTGRSLVLMLLPWPLKFIIDSVLFLKPLPAWLAGVLPDPFSQRGLLLNTLSIAMLVLGAGDALFAYAGNLWLLRAGQRAVFDMRRDLFAHLQRLSLAFHRQQKAGDLMSRLGGDVQTLQDFVVAMGTGFFSHLLTVLGMAVIMLMIDWRFALVAMTVIPVLLFLTQRYTLHIKRSFRHARHQEGGLWAFVQESIANIQIVQAYGREPHEEHRFAERAQASLKATLKANELQVQFMPLVGFIMAVAVGVTAWYGATRVLTGHITAGELLVFLAYLRGMASPIRQFAKMTGVIGKAGVATERLGEIFSEKPGIGEMPDPVRPRLCRGELEFRAVSFAYQPEHFVLRDVDFRVEPGRMLALVGATGSGKSTLASLIPRFHDPVSGQVLLDGSDLRELPLAFVREQVALVLQESLVFQGTVWENIAYGRAGADRTAAIAAARAAGIHDLIGRLPEGYDTPVGERGATLSGGQRQCISIARAMLRDAPLIILDEPSSGLDAFNEYFVMEAIRRLTQGRTTLIIAHRLATVVNADRILVLDQGRVVQSGTHPELMEQGGCYRQLWHCHDGHGPAAAAPGALPLREYNS